MSNKPSSEDDMNISSRKAPEKLAKESHELGITVKKSEDLSEWYTQVLQKAELIEYTDISGCYILRPMLYAMWEKATGWFDAELKKMNVQNSYFPLFIPKHLLTKEASHVEGFKAEVAWVTHGGDTKLQEPLAVRPTSETIMYDAFSKWIRSHRDLPLKINQWCNIVRWEFKHPTPLLRTREFLWHEAHTAHATHEEAACMVRDAIQLYSKLFTELYALPIMTGRKSENEKFAGAEYTESVETFLPNGRGCQVSTAHHLGQHFSKAFNITFLDENSKTQHVFQTSWGFSTRSLGILIMMHGDDKGLVLPPTMAPVQIAIVPIYKDSDKQAILAKAAGVQKELQTEYRVTLDDREYSPGWKFNHWELKGACIRLELGPKDLEKQQVVLVRRDSGKKTFVQIKELKKTIAQELETMQKDMLAKAQHQFNQSLAEVKNWTEFTKAIGAKKLVSAAWCATTACEAAIKEKTEGVKSLTIPFEQPKKFGTCVQCGKPATCVAYFGKSY